MGQPGIVGRVGRVDPAEVNLFGREGLRLGSGLGLGLVGRWGGACWQ